MAFRRRRGKRRKKHHRLDETLREHREEIKAAIAAPTPETKGLHAIAVFEAVKGIAVLLVGFGLFALLHHDVQDMAEEFVRALHMNPASHYPRILIDASANVDDSRLRALGAMAFAYSTVRLVEAYGLWHGRAWAEWFAIISGTIYLPVELYEVYERATPIRAIVFLGNLALVIYLIRARNRVAHAATVHPDPPPAEAPP